MRRCSLTSAAPRYVRSTALIPRVVTVDAEFAACFVRLPVAKQRYIAYRLAELVLGEEVRHVPAVVEALSAAGKRRSLGAQSVQHVDRCAEAWDYTYASADDQGQEAAADEAFRQARAISALAFAVSDRQDAPTEAVYEALTALGGDDDALARAWQEVSRYEGT